MPNQKNALNLSTISIKGGMKTIESDNLSTSHKNLVKKQFIDATDHKEIWFDPHPKPEARWSGTRLVKTSLTTAIRYWAAV